MVGIPNATLVYVTMCYCCRHMRFSSGRDEEVLVLAALTPHALTASLPHLGEAEPHALTASLPRLGEAELEEQIRAVA